MTCRPGRVIRMSRGTKLLTAGIVGAALLTAAPGASAAVSFTLPGPTGAEQVGTTSLHLVDTGRADPWKPDRRREVMISLWYPACDADRYPRAPWGTAGLAPSLDELAAQLGVPSGSVDWTSAKTAAHAGAPANGRRPVVLYSPGFGGPRSAGTVQAQDLASHGYVVVTIDHTYETTVEFPGGRVEAPVPQTGSPEQMKTAIDARVADTRFVLDALTDIGRGKNPDAEGHPLPRDIATALDLRRIGMFGHSYGGFTAGETMYNDRRIDAGVNLDGAMSSSTNPYVPGEVVTHGLDRPFLLMGSQLVDENGTVVDHSHTNDFDPSWGDFWDNQRAWKRDILLRDAAHYSYTDLQVILPQLEGPLNIPAARFEPVIGRIDPARSIDVQNTTIRGFLDRFVR
jgi:dienelactone hydrolase